MTNVQQIEQIRSGNGFIAALDQSGGSTPKALQAYGVSKDAYKNEDEMYDRIHEMRTRIVKAPDFTGEKVVGAILFENTMERTIDDMGSAQYLWDQRRVVPFLKVDKGLLEKQDGVMLMKPIPGLNALLARAQKAGIFGTKMRSVVDEANAKGIAAAVAQQFEFGQNILAHGLVPILEPEVTISIPDKAAAEEMVLAEIETHLNKLRPDQMVMLKLTLPEKENHYASLVDHPNVLSVVALSGGYSRDEANQRLSKNGGMIASFSRALTEGLSATQPDREFNDLLSGTIDSIHKASIAG